MKKYKQNVITIFTLLFAFGFMNGCSRMNLYEKILAEKRTAVIAHRGSSEAAPENTLAAFSQAIADGADFFELDCQLSADGEVIVLHDDKLDRTTNGEGSASERSLAEIKALDAGSWKDPQFTGERIPTLREALELAKGRIGVYIEIKSVDNDWQLEESLLRMTGIEPLLPDRRDSVMLQIESSHSENLELTRKVIDIVRDAKMARQVVLQSFSPVACAVALCEAPEMRTELLGQDDAKNPETWLRFKQWGDLLDVGGMNFSHPSANTSNIQYFHQRGQSVAIWTVDDEKLMADLIDRGINGLITNRPAAARALIGPHAPH